jgi:CRISPR-associated protein Cmr4
MDALPYFLVCRTPTRAGAGQRATDVIDLPLQREAHTDFPVIRGSSLKGALRFEVFRILKDKMDDEDDVKGVVNAVFGDEPGSGEPSPGAVAVSDAHVLAFPVKAEPGFVAWVTCPYQLRRLVLFLHRFEKLGDLRKAARDTAENASELEDGEALGPEVGIEVCLDRWKVETVDGCSELAEAIDRAVFRGDDLDEYVGGLLRENLYVVDDGTFREIVRSCTDVVTRVALDDRKTVEHGPWHEERLPRDTVLFGALNVRYDTVPPEDGVDARKVLFEGWKPDDVPDGDDEKLEALKKAAKKLKGERLLSVLEEGRDPDDDDRSYLDLSLQVGGSETVGFGLIRWRQYRNAGGGESDG